MPGRKSDSAGRHRAQLTWAPDLTARFGPQVAAHIGADGAPELVMQRDRGGHYVVPRTVYGVEVEFLFDTGATDVAVPRVLARRLKIRRGGEVEIQTASGIIPGHLVTLDDVTIGPLTLKRVRGSEHSIGDQVLLDMSILRHFELSQCGRSLTLRHRRLGEGESGPTTKSRALDVPEDRMSAEEATVGGARNVDSGTPVPR